MVALLLRVVTATAALPSLREVARDKGAEVTGSGTGTATSKSNDLDTRSEDMDDDDWLLDQITWSLCVCTSDDGVDPNHVDGGRREQQHQHHQEVQGTPMWIVDDDDGCMDRSDDVHASSQQQQPHKTFLPLRSADHGAVQWALHVES